MATNQRYQVINAGYASGYAPDTAFAYFRHKGIHLNPDVTLLGYFEGNDLFEVLQTQWPEVDLHGLPLRVTTDMYYIDSLGRLRMAAWLGLWSGVAKSPLSPLLHLKIVLRDHSQLLNFLMQKYRLFLIARSKRSTNLDDAASGDNQTSNAAYEPAYPNIDRVIKGLQALANQVGSRFIVVSIPARGHEREGHGFIRNWCERNRVPLIDLAKDFAQAESKNMYFTIGPHWNAQGLAHAAQAIYEYVSRNFSPPVPAVKVTF